MDGLPTESPGTFERETDLSVLAELESELAELQAELARVDDPAGAGGPAEDGS